jgi:hypothetical protein
MVRGSLVVTLLFAGTAGATARDEVAVGQCGLTFVNTGNSCEWSYGGEGPDPPDGEKLEACWDTATGYYNGCMDKALAAPPAGVKIDTTKSKLLNPTLPGSSSTAPTIKPHKRT